MARFEELKIENIGALSCNLKYEVDSNPAVITWTLYSRTVNVSYSRTVDSSKSRLFESRIRHG